MAFSSPFSNEIGAVAGGERFGSSNIILSNTVFEDKLKIGRFAKLDTAQIDNMDGSATPSIVGVILRDEARAIEDGAVIDKELYSQINYIRSGLVSVDVKTGETPALLGRVYVSNAGDANDGLATATNTDVAVNAEFIQEIQTGVWLIYLNPPQGDIATHIGDAVDAHAASAVSLLDTGAFTSQIEVEAAIAEIYPHVEVLIADPADAGAIPVTRSGNVALTSAGAETRTLANPAVQGIELVVSCDVYVGDIIITAASAVNQAGNTVITLGSAGVTIAFKAVQVAGALVWRVSMNDGATLA